MTELKGIKDEPIKEEKDDKLGLVDHAIVLSNFVGAC
jgi:hypothetical protein